MTSGWVKTLLRYDWGLPVRPTFLIVSAIMALIFVGAAVIVVPAEDAVILYEYARNLATSGVITYGGATTPIEGATDFLWMIVLAVLKRAGCNEFIAALALNFLGAGLILWLFRRSRLQVVFIASALIVTPFLYSALLGFSTLAFSAVYLVSLALMMRRHRYFHLALLILCLMRPDGVVWGAGPVMLNLLRQHSRHELLREATRLAAQLVIPGLLYFLWRLWYFGELLPLPFIVKAGGERTLWVFFADSARSVMEVIVPVAVAAALSARRKLVLVLLVALFVPPALFYSLIRLEQNIGGRFLAPMFFGALLVLRLDRRWLARLVLVALTFLAQFALTRTTVNQIRTSATETAFYIAKELQGLKGAMLVTEAGRLAYYSGWKVDDSWGLNTPAFARHLITESELKASRYDLIVAHCYTGLLVAEGVAIPAPGPQRNYSNLCHVLHREIVAGDYAIYLVPFLGDVPNIRKALLWPAVQLWRPTGCGRFDVFAVRRDSPVAAAVREIVMRFGAIEAPYGPRYYEPATPLHDQLCLSSGGRT